MFEVVVTVGPALDEKTIGLISQQGPIIFRINGAHADARMAQEEIHRIRGLLPEAKIMIDLPGNKVRTASLAEPINLIQGQAVDLLSHQLNFPEFHQFVRVGDVIYANDSKYKLEVIEVSNNVIRLLSHHSGPLENNKGFHLRGLGESLPFLFKRDLELIETAVKMEVDFLSLSFVRTAQDVRQVHELLAKSPYVPQLIAKIETQWAVKNLDEILAQVEIINVDRGDLSSDIGMIELPFAVKAIVEKSQKAGKKTFLATQFLKHMELYPVPLLSEIMGLHQAFDLGVHGLQLSEETAVGAYPVECVKTVFEMERQCLDKSPRQKNVEGHVYWLIGASGSGKTTVAKKLYQYLRQTHDNVVLLDGDEMREIFGASLGYDAEQRKINSHRNARLCQVLAKQGQHVVCPTIAPFEEVRLWNRNNLANYHEIFLDVPLDVLRERDQKKLYSSGAKNVVGVDIPFEKPMAADLILANYGENSADQSWERIRQAFNL